MSYDKDLTTNLLGHRKVSPNQNNNPIKESPLSTEAQKIL